MSMKIRLLLSPEVSFSFFLASFSAFAASFSALRLASEENRRTAKVTHGFVSWLDGEIDIAPETLYSESYKYTKEVYAQEF